ncbi:MAG TPA: hypothetical protein VGF45_18490 [Polyangia bacterium]
MVATVMAAFALALQTSGSPPLGLRYDAPLECPSARYFILRVTKRSDARLVEEEQRPHFIVTIRRTEGTVTGRIHEASSGSGEREIAAKDCLDVVDALALTASLSIARREKRAPRPAASVRSAVVNPSKDVPRRWSLGARVASDDALGFAYLSSGVGLFAESQPSAPFAGGRLHLGVPAFRVGIAHARTGTFQSNKAAQFTTTAVSLGLCPLGLEAGRLAFQGCAVTEGGLVTGRGLAVATPNDQREPWAAAGIEVVSSLPLSSTLVVSLDTSVLAALVRRDFVFERPHVPISATRSLFFRIGLRIAGSIL